MESLFFSTSIPSIPSFIPFLAQSPSPLSQNSKLSYIIKTFNDKVSTDELLRVGIWCHHGVILY